MSFLLGSAGTLIIGTWTAAAYSNKINNRIDNLETSVSKANGVPEDIASIKASLSDTQEDVRLIKNYILRK